MPYCEAGIYLYFWHNFDVCTCHMQDMENRSFAFCVHHPHSDQPCYGTLEVVLLQQLLLLCA